MNLKKNENVNYCKKFMYITKFSVRNFEDSTAIALYQDVLSWKIKRSPVNQ